MSNASVISRQASCSSILVRTSPDDAKRPESTMVTVQEHPEETGTNISPVEEKGTNISPVEETGSQPSPSISKSTTPKATKPAPPKTSAPLRRTMSKSVITHSKSTTNMTKPMNREMLRTMSKSVLRIGEHAPVSSKAVIKELTTESKTENTGTGPEKTEARAEKTEARPEKTEGGPEITEARPEEGNPEVSSLEIPKESGNITSEDAIEDENIELASDDGKKRGELKTE